MAGTSAQMLLRPISCASFGTTPTTVNGSPSRVISLPMASWLPLNRSRQKASLSTTTLRRSTSSARSKVRPATAVMPSAVKTSEVTH